jgi:exopolyphosphatase / guanosine-5'-triphosphate,3'-diphosphate pyrophosphatase
MRVGVIDVGSNTARLLVATVRGDGTLEPLAQERTYLRLGAEIERTGTLSKKTIRGCAATCGDFAQRAQELDVDLATVIVTAPGRQSASAAALTTALAETTGLPVRVLTAEAEGRLAYDGALARAESPLPDVVAVVDIGGGSTELVVGTRRLGTVWVRSADLGSLRLTRAHLSGDPPTARKIDAARDAVRSAFAGIDPPPADLALAVGGSARAIAKIVGRRLDAETLGEAIGLLARRPAVKAVRSLGISAERAETLLAGALVLDETCHLLGISLELGRGGLREGAALELAARVAARAA